MKILTKEILALLPPIGANAEKSADETLVPLKLFNPGGAGTWYICEYSPATGECFGYVTGLGGDELGYSDMNVLLATRNKMGLPLERDMYWDPKTTLAQVMSGEKS